MSKFDNASAVESLCWELRLASFGRSSKRAMVDDLFNGVAPYSQQIQEENNLSVNFNDNTACVAGHGARRQLMAAIQKPNNFLSVKVDKGPVHKRQAYSSSITKHINKPLKRSLPYYEDLPPLRMWCCTGLVRLSGEIGIVGVHMHGASRTS